MAGVSLKIKTSFYRLSPEKKYLLVISKIQKNQAEIKEQGRVKALLKKTAQHQKAQNLKSEKAVRWESNIFWPL